MEHKRLTPDKSGLTKHLNKVDDPILRIFSAVCLSSETVLISRKENTPVITWLLAVLTAFPAALDAPEAAGIF